MADEARKKQFDATSLVMGLLPLTLKDIAWPERRVVLLSRRPRKPVEIIVRALGVVPSIYASSDAEKQTTSSTSLYQRARRMPYMSPMLLVATTALGLVLAYAAFAVVEVYSKRSALGCVYPVFILTWHLLAIVPAAIDTAFSKIRRANLYLKRYPNLPLTQLRSTRGVGLSTSLRHQLLLPPGRHPPKESPEVNIEIHIQLQPSDELRRLFHKGKTSPLRMSLTSKAVSRCASSSYCGRFTTLSAHLSTRQSRR